MKNKIAALFVVVIALISSACTTISHSGGTIEDLDRDSVTVLLPKYSNATDDEFAGVALTQITASALMAKGLSLYQTEDVSRRINTPDAPGDKGNYQVLAKEVEAQYIILGTVHEYRYKTDLDGDPAVGITIRMVDVETGRTVWTGTSSNVGFINASLTSAGQRVVRDLIRQMPFEPGRL